MPARKKSEHDIAVVLRRMNIWNRKFTDNPIPFWNKGEFSGNKFVEQKPFDYVIGGKDAWGAVEVKSGDTSFQFLSLSTPGTKWKVDSDLISIYLFLQGLSNTESGKWPDELEKGNHGIQPHQRRALSYLNSYGGSPWLCLQLGHAPAGTSVEYPRQLWLVDWATWLVVEKEALSEGRLSISYRTAKEKLWAYQLEWNTKIKEPIKWNLPVFHPFRNIFSVDWTEPGQPSPVPGLTQRRSSLKGPTVYPATSEPL